MKENPCGRAQDLAGMKKDIRISRFPQLICVTDGPTDMTSYKLCKDVHKWKVYTPRFMIPYFCCRLIFSTPDLSFSLKVGSRSHHYKTRINPQSPWRLNQIQDSGNHLANALSILDHRWSNPKGNLR